MNIYKFCISMILFFCAFGAAVHAGMYQWVDENGVKHFSNVAPPSKADIKMKAEVKSKYIPPPKPVKSSTDILRDYKKDLVQRINSYKKSVKTHSNSNKSSSNNMKNYYKTLMDKYERRVKSCEEDLNDVKKESYSDTKWHKRKIRKREEWLADAKANFEYYKQRYNNAK